ncbi:hypothetical protein [Planctomicrobium piriforme]|uniref:Uncharacterized protein n=1 Tax=Planctomicrobium piriforme TaxID=1576369 RepID=A0A1I3NKQ3_9PLAN|nr:hypothetical protein [Planctomicrobium piriforme]SFJ09752.1 hypothetical protein SAMN05421753_115127 [Planctomicrobium piriforme]
MNTSQPGELPELIARLSDGSLSAVEKQRLNDLLLDDPIAQEEYLDHMLIDGLLEREFGGAVVASDKIAVLRSSGLQHSASTKVHPRRHSWKWVLAPVGLLTAIVSGWWFVAEQFDESRRRPLALANSGFEHGTTASAVNVDGATWTGDVADVVGEHHGIAPLEGKRMLRFVKSRVHPENNCELSQVIDLSGIAVMPGEEAVAIEASAFFNAVRNELADEGYTFGLTLMAFDEDPREENVTWTASHEQPLSFSGSHARADADSGSWQEVTASLPLPADAKYLMVSLAVTRPNGEQADEEFPGQFADRVALNLVHLRE